MFWVDVPYPDSVDALEQALRENRVIVQETRGSGDADGAYDRIERLVSSLPFDAYVAVIDAPPGVDAGMDTSRYLATVLSKRIGEPGLYVVSADSRPTGIRMVGTEWDETLFALQVYADGDAVEKASGRELLTPTVDAEVALQTALAASPQTEAGVPRDVSLPDDVVADLAEREQDLQTHGRPDLADESSEPWTTGKRWMVGVTVGAGLLAVLLQTLWGWPGWRRRPTRAADSAVAESVSLSPPDVEPIRSDATSQLTSLAEALVTAPPGEHHHQATLAREAAEALLDSDDPLDVVGALVLARAGRRELAIAAGRARVSFQVCFFDPRHPAASRQGEWRFGDTVVEVPVCRACGRSVDAGRAPQVLASGRGRRLRPYYEGDTVWARTGYGSLSADLAELASRVTDTRRGTR